SARATAQRSPVTSLPVRVPSASCLPRLRPRRTPGCSCRVPPSLFILVEFIPAPTADLNHGLRPQPFQESNFSTSRHAAVFLGRHNPGDRPAMSGHHIALSFTACSEERRELTAGISGRNRLSHHPSTM